MMFWKLAYNSKWVTVAQLHSAVKTADNLYGDITPEEFKEITAENF